MIYNMSKYSAKHFDGNGLMLRQQLTEHPTLDSLVPSQQLIVAAIASHSTSSFFYGESFNLNYSFSTLPIANT